MNEFLRASLLAAIASTKQNVTKGDVIKMVFNVSDRDVIFLHDTIIINMAGYELMFTPEYWESTFMSDEDVKLLDKWMKGGTT